MLRVKTERHPLNYLVSRDTSVQDERHCKPGTNKNTNKADKSETYLPSLFINITTV